MTHGWRGDVLLMIAAFATGTLLAEAFGAANLGTAMAFGQIAFVLALIYVLVRRD